MTVSNASRVCCSDLSLDHMISYLVLAQVEFDSSQLSNRVIRIKKELDSTITNYVGYLSLSLLNM